MAVKLSAGVGRRTARQNADINVTPFVDILLVLLVIFMVAAPTAVTSIRLDIPPASKAAPPGKPVVISLQRSGALFLTSEKTSLDTLAQDLDRRFVAEGQGGQRGDQRVMVMADADVPYEAFMGVINQVHRNGWTQVELINEDVR